MQFQTSLAEQKVSDLVKEHNIRRMTDNQNRSNFGNLIRKFFKPTCLKPMFLLTAIFTFQQVTGIYITIFYAVSFFKVGPFIASLASNSSLNVFQNKFSQKFKFLFSSDIFEFWTYHTTYSPLFFALQLFSFNFQ